MPVRRARGWMASRGWVASAAAALAAGLSAEVAREEAAAPVGSTAVPGNAEAQGPDRALWDDELPLFPLQPPRMGRELLADHVTAMVCCAAMDTAGATPGLDWLDGPSLLINGERAADLAPRVLHPRRGRRPRTPARLAPPLGRPPGEAGPPGLTARAATLKRKHAPHPPLHSHLWAEPYVSFTSIHDER